MKNIVWLASYPKSGNTWVRAILNLALFKNSDINNMSIYSLNHYIKNNYPNNIRKLPGEIKKYWDIAQETISENAGSNSVILKTHNIYGKIGDVNFPNKKFTSKVVYVIRDPRDVCISYSHHFGLNLSTALQHILSKTNYIFDNKNTLGEVLSSWQNHVNSWVNSDTPKIIIKYEDLLLNPKSVILRLFDFLKIELIVSIDEIISQTSFKNLQDVEKNTGFVEASQKNSLFFRNGTKNQWTKYNKKKFIPLINEFEKTMKHFDYI